MTPVRVLAFGLVLAALAGCQKNDLLEPPVPLGNFVLGHNIVVTDKMQKVPISRPATGAEWEAAVEKAMADRFGRYQGTKIYDFGISIDAFALAPPGIPVVASPKSVLVISANVWDDAAKLKLNAEAERIYVFESLSPQTALGSGLTQSRQRQIDQLACQFCSNSALPVRDRSTIDHNRVPSWRWANSSAESGLQTESSQRTLSRS